MKVLLVLLLTLTAQANGSEALHSPFESIIRDKQRVVATLPAQGTRFLIKDKDKEIVSEYGQTLKKVNLAIR